MSRIVQLIVLVIMLFSFSPVIASTALGPITLDYFGLHIHRSDQGTAWPSVPFGSWRLWDANVGWAQLEPEPGKWDFKKLDRYVAMAKLTKVDLLLPLAITPRWASARPNEPSSYKLGNAAEPYSIDLWRNYVSTVAKRYKGRIKAYEIWNETNIPSFFSGDINTLVCLTKSAREEIKKIDPTALIVSPGITTGSKGHLKYLNDYLAQGGGSAVDIVGYHMYVQDKAPEAIVPLIRQIRLVMKRNGIANKPLWNTETGWWLANGDGTLDHPMVAKGGWRKLGLEKESGDYLFRAFVLARAEGVERFYWYSWDNRYGLGMIEPTAGTPKPVVKSWRSMIDILLGTTINSCSANANEWTCLLIDSTGKKKNIFWTSDPAEKQKLSR